MRNLTYAWLVVGQISTTAVIQLAPMLGLPVTDYALYSAIYLGYAACVAITYATISDVWARALRRAASTERLVLSFQAALTSLAVICGALVGLLSALITQNPLLGVSAALATATAVYRSGVAYRLVAAGRIRRAGAADLVGAIVAAGITGAALTSGGYSPALALLCWTAGSAVSCVALAAAPRWNLRETIAWISDHRRDIALLSGEAAIKTLESVGTPYVVGGIGGLLALALHRAASSLTYPVRLVVDVLRSRIISGAIGSSAQAVLVIGTIGAVAGAGVGGGLVILGRWEMLGPDTIVVQMAPHALAVAAWVWTTSISSFIQFAGRGSFTGRRLIIRRVAHTIIVLGLTASGVLAFGPGAVIWFAAISELVAAPLWVPSRAERRAGSRVATEMAS